MDAMIQLIHVSRFYNRRAALSDVTLEVEKGDFVLLMGPSGAGKSTLLRMLIGAEQPDEGQIFVQGKNVTKLKQSEVPYLRRKVGSVFQDFRLLSKKSVFDNVALPLIVQGASAVDIKRKVTEALRAVGVEHKKDQLPSSLSAGSNSASASPGRSSTDRSCCWRTNRPAISIPNGRRKSSSCSN